jgi:osmotically-inducible protein OsmY
MEDRSSKTRPYPPDRDFGLPETEAEAEALAASIERAVQQHTGRGIRNLSVEVNRDGILLRGRCNTYYAKQLAQQAVMSMRGGGGLTNRIEVG